MACAKVWGDDLRALQEEVQGWPERARAVLDQDSGQEEELKRTPMSLDLAPNKEQETTTSDEDEDGFPRAKLGSGHWGRGPPWQVEVAGKRRDLVDGAGLCSPGRWAPDKRGLEQASGISANLRIRWLKLLGKHLDVKKTVCTLATNRCTQSPFGNELVQEAREAWLQVLHEKGAKRASLGDVPGQLLKLKCLGPHAEAGDPDHRFVEFGTHNLVDGVGLGVRADDWLPRVPAVFGRKSRWRKYDEEEGDPENRENYPSAIPVAG